MQDIITIIVDSIKQVFSLEEVTLTTLAIFIIALLVVMIIKLKK